MSVKKEKLNESIQVNFNHSKEIVYWSQRFNVTPNVFQKAFQESGYSIAKTLEQFNTKAK